MVIKESKVFNRDVRQQRKRHVYEISNYIRVNPDKNENNGREDFSLVFLLTSLVTTHQNGDTKEDRQKPECRFRN